MDSLLRGFRFDHQSRRERIDDAHCNVIGNSNGWFLQHWSNGFEWFLYGRCRRNRFDYVSIVITHDDIDD